MDVVENVLNCRHCHQVSVKEQKVNNHPCSAWRACLIENLGPVNARKSLRIQSTLKVGTHCPLITSTLHPTSVHLRPLSWHVYTDPPFHALFCIGNTSLRLFFAILILPDYNVTKSHPSPPCSQWVTQDNAATRNTILYHTCCQNSVFPRSQLV